MGVGLCRLQTQHLGLVVQVENMRSEGQRVCAIIDLGVRDENKLSVSSTGVDSGMADAQHDDAAVNAMSTPAATCVF